MVSILAATSVIASVIRLKSMMHDVNQFKRYVSYGIAALLVVSASLGLLYNASSLFAVFEGAFDDLRRLLVYPTFYTSFYIMSVICIGCYLAIIAASRWSLSWLCDVRTVICNVATT